MPKIAFLALDDIHHLHHIVPIALELSQDKNYQCVIYLQTHCLALTQKIALLYPQHRCQIEILSPSFVYKITRRFRQGICSSRRILRRHAKTLLAFDALFTPDMNLDELMSRAQRTRQKPQFFANLHGAGDWARSFHLLADYDYVLLCGEKPRRVFFEAGYLNASNSAVVGYPKFDVIPSDYRPQLFADQRPIVLYNPHSSLNISSWGAWGLDILEYFYQNKAYNFIFAPHCNLFRRHLSAKTIPAKYFSAANIIIDLGSENSVNMTYTQAADIYLGDASSQVYEFIRHPRPCLFLNPHQFAWQNNENYTSWNLGTVINELTELKQILSHPVIPNPYIEQQQHAFADTFSITSHSAASRAADAIRQRFLD